MSEQISYFDRFSQQACFIAADGAQAPEIMHGRLIFRRYYRDSAKTQEDAARSASFLLDTVYHETDRFLRLQRREIDRGGLEICAVPLQQICPAAGEGFLAVYTPAAPDRSDPDGENAMLAARGIHAESLAVILAGKDASSCRCLSEEEAERLLRILQEDSSLMERKS